ncbi:MAG: sensor histidine kinase [Acidimicrobiales bacterium]
MSSVAAEAAFAAEFALFLVSAAGVALVLLGGQSLARSAWGRGALGAGFAGMGGASFLSGSLLFRPSSTVPIGLETFGLACLAAGSFAWAQPLASRTLERLGVALASAAVAITAASASGIVRAAPEVSYAFDALAATALGSALHLASRSSIAAKVASTAAAGLLAVVLVLSVALSSVLSSTVRSDALRRLAAEQAAAMAELRSTSSALVQDAEMAGSTLSPPTAASAATLGGAFPTGSLLPASQARSHLLKVKKLVGPDVGLALSSPSGSVLSSIASSSGGTGLRSIASLATSGPALQAARTGRPALWSEAEPSGMAEAAAYPVVVTLRGGRHTVAIAIAASRIGPAYLAAHAPTGPGLGLALVAGGRVVSSTGQPALPSGAAAAAAGALRTSSSVIETSHGVLIAAAPFPVAALGPPVALVLTFPGSVLAGARAALFETLFSTALGATVLGLVLAAVAGDRIGGGLAALTRATERVSRGESGVRVEVSSPDEIGALGRAFSTMAESIDDKTQRLRLAAEDESRLRGRLEAVVAGMSEALVATDAEGRIVDFNKAAEQLCGTSADQARGRALSEVVPLKPVAEAAAATGGAVGRYWLAIAGMPDVPVAVSSGSILGPGGLVVGTVHVVRDLTGVLEIERMKSEFLSRVGHELRTPLTVVIAYAELLERREVDAERSRAWHGEILSQSKRLLRVVEMLEYFASQGAGRELVRLAPADVRPLLVEVAEAWAARAGPSVRVSHRLARGLPPVMLDRRWMVLALNELLDNAVKFSPNGGPVLLSAAASGGTVSISVSDHGKGMSEQEREVAWAEFTQGDASDTRAFGGLGLGLALVRRVAEGHGGQVSCRSVPGKGSTFTLQVPEATVTASSSEGGSRSHATVLPEDAGCSGGISPPERTKS